MDEFLSLFLIIISIVLSYNIKSYTNILFIIFVISVSLYVNMIEY